MCCFSNGGSCCTWQKKRGRPTLLTGSGDKLCALGGCIDWQRTQQRGRQVKGRRVSVFSTSFWRKLPEDFFPSKDVLGTEKHLLIFIKLLSCYSRRDCCERCTIWHQHFCLERRAGRSKPFSRTNYWRNSVKGVLDEICCLVHVALYITLFQISPWDFMFYICSSPLILRRIYPKLECGIL